LLSPCAVRKYPPLCLRIFKITTCSWCCPRRAWPGAITALARAYLQAKLCVFLTGSAVLLCVLIALSWRAYGALSAARVLFRRPRHVARIGASISQLTSVSRGMPGPCMPWHMASQPMAACAELPCRSHFVRVLAAITHCVLLLAEKQRRSAIGTPNSLRPLELSHRVPIVPLNLSPSCPARRISCACLPLRAWLLIRNVERSCNSQQRTCRTLTKA
jgi:hypothetical protein